MDIKKIEILLSAIDHGNITAAADEAGYTQSGVSHIIKGLESEFHFPLLHRLRTGVAPTEEAKQLLPILREIAGAGNKLTQVSSAIRGLETGVVRIGTITSISAHWLPRILREFGADHPQIDVRLVDGGDAEIEGWIETGRVEFGLYGFSGQQPFEWICLGEDPLLAVLPRDHPLADLAECPIDAFQGQPFITAPMDIHYAVHGLFLQHKIKPVLRYSPTDDYTTVTLIEQGLGISIMPQLVMRGYSHCNVRVLPLAPASTRTLGIAVRSLKNISPAAKAFIGYLRRIVPQLMQEA